MKEYTSKVTILISSDIKVTELEPENKRSTQFEALPCERFLIEKGIHEVPDEVTKWNSFKTLVKEKIVRLIVTEKEDGQLPPTGDEEKEDKKDESKKDSKKNK